MTRRTRVYAIVGAATALAAGAAAATVVLTSSGDGKAATERPRGRPPLELDLGIRRDPEAVALRMAAVLYDRGRVQQARSLFGRYTSVPARIGTAMTAWPDGTLEQLGRLAAGHPDSSLVRLNLGLALYWAGRTGSAVAAWRSAKRVDPDTFSAIRADDLLHPRYNRGLPTFVPSFAPPARLARLSPERELDVLANGRSIRMRLLYGVALQRLGHPRSAERAFAAAAAAAPSNPDAQVAAAVGLFDKDRPALAFSRLGPLTRRFPHASTVRFHLGLLLLWLGQVREGTRQLRLARSVAPKSTLGREAATFLEKLRATNRPSGPSR